MLSYRHAFHAGNHADVLKHVCLMLLLNKLTSKNKPCVYIDTHAGAGCYDLNAEQAQKTSEYQGGVAQLGDIKDSVLNAYQQLIAPFWQQCQYPGSPLLAAKLLRSNDSLHLIEWHNEEVANLRRTMRPYSQAAVHHRNGFEALVALTPPKPARGLVLIDPAYELGSDYQQLVTALQKACKRWATGVYAIWYPLLAKRSGSHNPHSKAGLSEKMLQQLSALPVDSLLNVQLWVDTPSQGGMYGSGMAIINPPWQFDQQIKACLPELTQLLAQSGGAGWQLDWLKQEQ